VDCLLQLQEVHQGLAVHAQELASKVGTPIHPLLACTSAADISITLMALLLETISDNILMH